MSKYIIGTRYLVIVPIIGLALASAALFIFGGYGLIKLVVQQVLVIFKVIEELPEEVPVFVRLVEYVHTFLIGTVLYITAVGFFQLFIKEIEFPEWLRIESTEELETNLIGVLWPEPSPRPRRRCCNTERASPCPSLPWPCTWLCGPGRTGWLMARKRKGHRNR